MQSRETSDRSVPSRVKVAAVYPAFFPLFFCPVLLVGSGRRPGLHLRQGTTPVREGRTLLRRGWRPRAALGGVVFSVFRHVGVQACETNGAGRYTILGSRSVWTAADGTAAVFGPSTSLSFFSFEFQKRANFYHVSRTWFEKSPSLPSFLSLLFVFLSVLSAFSTDV